MRQVTCPLIAGSPSKKILNLAVGVLGFGGYAGVADQFGHWSFEYVSQLMVETRFYVIGCDT